MEVIVIGAGISGLAAADELTRAGIKPTIIEARDRIGGRIFTVHDIRVAAPIELGAEFVHGRPPQIFDLAKQFGLEIVETGGNTWRLDYNGDLVPMGDELPRSDDDLWVRAEAHIIDDRPDVSLEQFLRMCETAEIPDSEKEWTRRFVAGFHAADLEKAGIYGLVKTQKAGEEIGGETANRIATGYSALASVLYEKSHAAGGKYLLGNVVKSINWVGPAIEVVAEDSNGGFRTLTADKVIVTLPISVLKAPPDTHSYIRFVPDITEKRNWLDQIEMGSARRIILTFNEKWWISILEKIDPRRSKLGFLFAQDVPISVWWTDEPSDAAILIGWIGGEKARGVAEFTDEELTDLAISSLNKIFKTGESLITGMLLAAFSHNWDRDPCSIGAYSYLAVGGVHAPEKLSESVDDKLYFSGEATDHEGHWGTVHGAISSGIRAAREIISQLGLHSS
jgi:monoamine oxidase